MNDKVKKLLEDRYFLKNESSWEQLADRVDSIYPEITQDIKDMRFIPGSPFLMNANTKGERKGTLSSCFPMNIDDSMESIMDSMKEAALVTKMCGGVGYDFSTLRGNKENVKGTGKTSGGIMSFISIYDAVLEGVRQGIRRGAGMSLLSITHPQILDFIDAKKNLKDFNRSNFSVKITNKFYETLEKEPNKVFKTINIVDKKENDLVDSEGKTYTYKMLWDKIIENAWSFAEPGIINSDYINDRVTVQHIDNKALTNPCSEFITTVPYSPCCLGSIDVSKFVIDGKFDSEPYCNLIRKATRFLDNSIDINEFPLQKIKDVALSHRPIGLGMMGFAHALYKLNIPYNSDKAKEMAYTLMEAMTMVSMDESINIAKEKGSFKWYNEEVFLKANERLRHNPSNNYIYEKLKKYGCRNSSQTSIAPTGSISTIATCLVGDTEISTLNGKIKIKDLVGTQPVVYSVNNQGKLTVSQSSKVWLSRKNADVIKLIFDDDSYLICTKEHLIRKSDGEYIAAGEVKKLDSITHFHKMIQTNGRTWIGITNNKKMLLEHRIVAEFKLGRKLKKDEHVHHIDENIYNNNPDNLLIVNSSEHARIHNKFDKRNSELKGKTFEEIYGIEKTKQIKEKWKEKRSKNVWNKGRKWTDEEKLKISDTTKKAMSRDDIRKKYEIGMIKSGRKLSNFKIKDIIYSYGQEDVYDMEIPINHNFIANNIVVHNCSSGIEPVFGLVYTRKIETGNKIYTEMYVVDPVFEKYVESWHKDNKDEIYKYVSNNKGSVQGCNFLTKEEQNIFLVAGDINPIDHLNILEVFAKYVSLSVSKTINMPKTATKEDVSNVYVNAFKKGIIGVTVYRDECREGILVHKTDDKKTEVIERRDAIKRPQDLECDIKIIKVKQDTMVVLVGKLNGLLYEMFVSKIEESDREKYNKYETGIIRKVKTNHYRLLHGDQILIDNLGKFGTTVERSLCRMISTSLRHLVPLKFLVEQLNKAEDFTSFDKCVARVLKSYIKDGESYSTPCPSCGEKLTYYDGCIKCFNCDWSKCG